MQQIQITEAASGIVLYKKAVLKRFTKLTGKYLWKKEKNSMNTLLYGTSLVAASDFLSLQTFFTWKNH